MWNWISQHRFLSGLTFNKNTQTIHQTGLEQHDLRPTEPNVMSLLDLFKEWFVYLLIVDSLRPCRNPGNMHWSYLIKSQNKLLLWCLPCVVQTPSCGWHELGWQLCRSSGRCCSSTALCSHIVGLRLVHPLILKWKIIIADQTSVKTFILFIKWPQWIIFNV